MSLQPKQNVSFVGTVEIVNLRKGMKISSWDGDYSLLRPLIKQLKHHCGSKDVHHTINVGDIQIGVTSSYTAAKKVNGIDSFIKGSNIITEKSFQEKNINDLVEWSKKEINVWMQDIRKQEKAIRKQEKEVVKNTSEPSFFKKLLNRFF